MFFCEIGKCLCYILNARKLKTNVKDIIAYFYFSVAVAKPAILFLIIIVVISVIIVIFYMYFTKKACFRSFRACDTFLEPKYQAANESLGKWSLSQAVDPYLKKNQRTSYLRSKHVKLTRFGYICKATTVTHTKRIDRNLLRKETSFVCCTSSVLRKSRHMKQKEKITHCC